MIFILLTVLVSPCFSEDSLPADPEKQVQKGFFSDINYSVGTGLSYLNGQYREIVYTNTNSANPYLSELLWDLDNIFLLNFTLGASKGPWSLDLSLGTAVTEGSGIMEDYDWGDYSKSDWTNWSTSLIFLDKSFFLDVNSSYKYRLNSSFSFPVKLGYKLNYLDWEDESGEYIYYWDFDTNGYYIDPDTPITGDLNGVNGIDYKVIQNIFYASAGVLFTTGNVTTGLNIALSPFIYAWDLDHHIIRKMYFLDSFIANFWYKTELTLKLKTSPKGELLLTVFREEMPEAAGDTFQYNEDSSDSEEVGIQTGYYPNGAGLAFVLWGIGLSYIWTF